MSSYQLSGADLDKAKGLVDDAFLNQLSAQKAAVIQDCLNLSGPDGANNRSILSQKMGINAPPMTGFTTNSIDGDFQNAVKKYHRCFLNSKPSDQRNGYVDDDFLKWISSLANEQAIVACKASP